MSWKTETLTNHQQTMFTNMRAQKITQYVRQYNLKTDKPLVSQFMKQSVIIAHQYHYLSTTITIIMIISMM